jgi:hypothetical protein
VDLHPAQPEADVTDLALQESADARSAGDGEGTETFRSDLLRIYLPAVIGFLVINITNATILGSLAKHGLLYGADSSGAENEAKTAQFFLVPIKGLLFTLCTALLGFQLVPSVKRIVRQLTEKDIVQTLISMGIGLLLTSTIFPMGFGRSYARISTDPFSQMPDQLYRRLLIPGLAYIYHLNGFLYIIPVWAFLVAAVLATKVYFSSKGHRLSLLEEVSLLTVGIFITSFQIPGNPEAAVILLALIALMEFEHTGQFGGVQLAALCLALMAHETCAFIVFAPIVLFLFPKRSWLPCLAVVLAYGLALIANFSFDLTVPLRTQGSVSNLPASFFFLRSPANDIAAVFFSFKLLWIFVAVGTYYQFREHLRGALFVLSGFALAIGSMYIAVDYSRVIGFATISMLFCYRESVKHFSRRMLNTVAAFNILIPSLFVSGLARPTPFHGLYIFGIRWLARFVGPNL